MGFGGLGLLGASGSWGVSDLKVSGALCRKGRGGGGGGINGDRFKICLSPYHHPHPLLFIFLFFNFFLFLYKANNLWLERDCDQWQGASGQTVSGELSLVRRQCQTKAWKGQADRRIAQRGSKTGVK